MLDQQVRHGQITSNLYELRKLLGMGLVTRECARDQSWIFIAATTRALILLNDLLQKAAAEGQRVGITDDVYPSGKEKDLTSLIATCRNAACHIDNEGHRIGEATFTWVVSGGQALSSVAGQIQTSQYEDDTAIFFGRFRLYLQRNLYRARDEVERLYGHLL